MRPSLVTRVLVVSTLLVASRMQADPCAGRSDFVIGTGLYDVTGPPAEATMMGYAMPFQRTQGLHTRLYARAAIVQAPCNGKRVAVVAVETAMITLAVKADVVRQLRTRFGDVYNDANVLLGATHTHSAPGGTSHYFLYDVTVLGFSEQNFRAVADGIVEAISRAHRNLAQGRVEIAAGDLLDAAVNRSPPAYVQNPAEERGRYAHDTDKRMTLLRLVESDGTVVGLLDWYAVHATSMGNTNRLISSDNKGYAALRFERGQRTAYDGSKTFVAAFLNANEGDVSPNVDGKEDPADDDDAADTRVSGEKQYRRARELFALAEEKLSGGVDFRHVYVKLDDVDVAADLGGGEPRTTCPAAIGLSMLAGAEDGRGVGVEGLACNPKLAPDLQILCALTTDCQAEKPISLEMGTRKPVPWSPDVVPLQILRIGRLVVVNVPFEPTTMAGRRLRETVAAELQGRDGAEPPLEIVVTGLANAYAGYVVTREEYAAQHYEGASTHFGPWSLAALQQEFRKLAAAMREERPVEPGPIPRDMSKQRGTLVDAPLFDEVPDGNAFGEVVEQPAASYRRGETARATFWTANPNSDLMTQSSYLQVQHRTDDEWKTVAVDRDWETKFHWRRFYCPPTLQCSQATIEWEIPEEAEPGTYRIRHDGHARAKADGAVKSFSGLSNEFVVN